MTRDFPPSSHRNGRDMTRSEYSRHTEVNMTRQGGKFPPCCVPCQSSEVTRRDDHPLFVMLTWEIDVARRDAALLVTPTWKIDMARGAVALLFTLGYRHGKEGHSPSCHAKTGCRWGWGLPGWSEFELRRSILGMVGRGAAEGNQPAPKS